MSGCCRFSIFYRGRRKCFELCLAAKHPVKMCRFSETARRALFSLRKKTYPQTSQVCCLQVCKYAPSLFLPTKTIRKTIRNIIECTLKGGDCICNGCMTKKKKKKCRGRTGLQVSQHICWLKCCLLKAAVNGHTSPPKHKQVC